MEVINTINMKKIIKKYIERNFGGLEINIDFENDFDELYEFEKYQTFIYRIIFEIISKRKKLSKSQIFKIIYNFYCKDNEEEEYIFDEEDIYDFDYLQNIKDNIKDLKSRYLLLGIKPSEALLIHQIISKELKQHIYFYEGSSFIKDYNNEYILNVINIISDHARKGDVIILYNLNQIYDSLYDLFDNNYTIYHGKQYTRIHHKFYLDKLLQVDIKFRIIIFEDINKLDYIKSSFLSKFENIFLQFSQTINKPIKSLASSIINELDIKMVINKSNYEYNYNLKDLLIGCHKDDILQMIQYELILNKNIKEHDIKKNIYNKIYKLLPQDIIINLDDSHELKKLYFSKKEYYNLEHYLNSNFKYKVSIIYTFNNIFTKINCIDESLGFITISEIKSEKQLRKYINDIIADKNNNQIKNKNNNSIIIIFDISNLNKINYIINFIFNNYYDIKELKFIFIVHIKRNFSFDEDKIFLIPDINSDVYQLFIDNLNGLDIKLNDIITNPIQYFVDNNFINLENEFNKAKKIYAENNLENLELYFQNNMDIKASILEKIKSYINIKENNLNFNNIVENIYNLKYINENSVDLISVIIEYVRKEIVSKNIYKILEDNYNIEDNLKKEKNNEKVLNKDKIINPSFKNANNDDINKIKEENIKLKEENKKLKEIISKNPFNLTENEYILSLIIITKDEKVIFSLICKNTDKFIQVEEKFYKEYPEYFESKGCFRINNNLIEKNKTLEESNLKNNDIIIFEEFEKNEEECHSKIENEYSYEDKSEDWKEWDEDESEDEDEREREYI